jgi:hypothetical protein
MCSACDQQIGAEHPYPSPINGKTSQVMARPDWNSQTGTGVPPTSSRPTS